MAKTTTAKTTKTTTPANEKKVYEVVEGISCNMPRYLL